MELHAEKPKLYVERVTAFLKEAREWCTVRGLAVTDGSVELNEESLPKYNAPSLFISTKIDPRVSKISLAKIVPIGSAIIGAQGRIDLIGHVTSHAFLFYVGKGPSISMKMTVNGKTSNESSRPMLSGVDGDGWYWIESSVRTAKRVDEELFIDLFTDVSDYDF